MEKQTHQLFFFLLFFCSTITLLTVKGSHEDHRHHHSVKLFVFGDSYVDTGNLGKYASSWKEPYGISYPRKPSGRASDGRVLTDYIASFFGIKSPVPYERRNITRKSKLRYGMNFAYGGTAVLTDLLNMTIQINNFQELIDKNVYTKSHLDNSVALVAVAVNDYTLFLLTNGSLQHIPAFTKELVKQLAMDLKRIKGLGVQNVVVTGQEPIGCLPLLTAQNSYQKCLQRFNSVAQFHNLVLKHAVKKLNKESHPKSGRFVLLNIYKPFNSALKKMHYQAKLKLNQLKPCCVGLDGYSCGSVDDKGVKKYSVCKNPELAFYWDTVHPTQSGWHAAYSSLKSSLQPINK